MLRRRDAEMLVLSVLVGSFALWVTVHVAVVTGLFARGGPWRALVALLVPPMAPVWGLRHGLVARSLVWLGACCLYGGALLASLR